VEYKTLTFGEAWCLCLWGWRFWVR